MTVDFNNLRKQAAYKRDDVIKTLNAGLLPDTENVLVNGKWISGNVLFDKDDLQDDIDELRSLVWTLLCCYEEGNPDYACVYEEVEKSGGLARFNDDDEEGKR